MAKKKDTEQGPDETAAVAEALSEEQERGYRGTVPDPTPNHAYTVAGVTGGEPTPETDDDLRAQAREASGR
jgi:hypothetical protein